MSNPEPEPQPPEPQPDSLADLADRLAQFDPGEIRARLDQLEQRAPSGDPPDLLGPVREALAPFFEELGATLKETRDALAKLVKGEPPSDQPPAPAASPSPPPPPKPKGLLDNLFSVPTLPGG